MSQELNYNTIGAEWDAIAEERYDDLKSGKDLSYILILKPSLIKSLMNSNRQKVLDVGCGVGVFTEEIGLLSERVIAVDISRRSIEIAKNNNVVSNVEYLHGDVSCLETETNFTTVVSNMTMMNIPDLLNTVSKIKSLLSSGGRFIFTITHPAFWPIYWGYNGDGFDYNSEIEIVSNFKTRTKDYSFKTRHYHRPLAFYVSALLSNGFTILKLDELKDISGDQWYPRFLLIEADLI